MRDVNGFKQRGEEMTRLETFTDAAFAFAVTLLVVGDRLRGVVRGHRVVESARAQAVGQVAA